MKKGKLTIIIANKKDNNLSKVIECENISLNAFNKIVTTYANSGNFEVTINRKV
ncbi:hypothetical protein [Sulfurimonas sp.]|uniref:hypothetical protein n=1 Tax=Sulfurimonas sp. TaxID=2022749 RepID=UPI003D0D7F69